VPLERDGEREVLEGALHRATRGTGCVVLVSGEAGIGKASLVRAFLRAAAHRATVLQGACDDLLTPRTLGPLRDAARGLGGPLGAALADGDRDAVLAAVLIELGGARPTSGRTRVRTRRWPRPSGPSNCSPTTATPPGTRGRSPGSTGTPRR